eukprot:scaffold287614_cov17-Prasinocladus_malaysianus.AAC.1
MLYRYPYPYSCCIAPRTPFRPIPGYSYSYSYEPRTGGGTDYRHRQRRQTYAARRAAFLRVAASDSLIGHQTYSQASCQSRYQIPTLEIGLIFKLIKKGEPHV